MDFILIVFWVYFSRPRNDRKKLNGDSEQDYPRWRNFIVSIRFFFDNFLILSTSRATFLVVHESCMKKRAVCVILYNYLKELRFHLDKSLMTDKTIPFPKYVGFEKFWKIIFQRQRIATSEVNIVCYGCWNSGMVENSFLLLVIMN